MLGDMVLVQGRDSGEEQGVEQELEPVREQELDRARVQDWGAVLD